MSCRLPQSALSPQQWRLAQQELLVQGQESDYGPPEIVEAWGISTEYYYLPLAYCLRRFPSLLPAPPEEDSPKDYWRGKHRFLGSCRNDIQREVVTQAQEYLQQQRTVLLSLNCGCGKTALSILLASLPWVLPNTPPGTTPKPLKTAVLVHRTVLTDQWVSSIRRFTTAQVQVVASGEPLDLEADFYIFNTAFVPKTWHAESKSWQSKTIGVYQRIGILIVDEAHVACAQEMSKALFHFQPWLSIALTATPQRRDGLDGVLDLYFGAANRIVRVAQSPFTVFRLPTKYRPEFQLNSRGKKDWNSVISALVTNPERNALLVSLVEQFHTNNIMILSKRVEHCDFLAQELRRQEAQQWCPQGLAKHWWPTVLPGLPTRCYETLGTALAELCVDDPRLWNRCLLRSRLIAPLPPPAPLPVSASTAIEAAPLSGGKRAPRKTIPKEARRSSITVMKGTDRSYDNQARILISTFSKLGVGFDDPRLDLLLVACDVVEIEQYAGRLREAPGKNRIIIDLVDNDANCLSHWRERRRWYLSRNGHVADYYRSFPGGPGQCPPIDTTELLTITDDLREMASLRLKSTVRIALPGEILPANDDSDDGSSSSEIPTHALDDENETPVATEVVPTVVPKSSPPLSNATSVAAPPPVRAATRGPGREGTQVGLNVVRPAVRGASGFRWQRGRGWAAQRWPTRR